MKAMLGITLIVVCIYISGCKKSENTAVNIVQFDVDSVHYSYSVRGGIQVVDTGAQQYKLVILQVPGAVLFTFNILLYDPTPPLRSGYITSGHYRTLYCPNTCQSSGIIYADGTNFYVDDTTDSLSHIDITAGPGSPPVINGTFDAWVGDAGGTAYKHLINGKIIDASY
jgi:hypothetical protein